MPAVSPFFRHRIGRPKYPGLWRNCLLAFSPGSMGPSGGAAYDLSPWARRGALTNITIASAWSVIGGRYAISCDGSNDLVDFGAMAELNGLRCATLSGWLYRTSTGVAVGFGRRGAGNGERFSIIWNNDGNVYAICDQGVGVGGGFASRAFSGTGWHHFAFVFTPSVATVYIDGALSAGGSAGIPAAIPSSTAVFALGILFGTSDFSGGSYDDIAVHNRPLTAGEVRLLASRRGVAYETLPFQAYSPPPTNLLDARRRAVVC